MLDPSTRRVYGLTYRVGHHVPGLSRILTDVLHDAARPLLLQWAQSDASDAAGAMAGQGEGGGGDGGWAVGRPSFGGPIKSLLVVGRPGLGKTTMIRWACKGKGGRGSGSGYQ
jgi:hypothetical protein